MRIREYDRNLKIRLGGEFLINILYWCFFPFIAIYLTDELGKVMAGTLLIVSQALSVVVNLMAGYFADRYGRKLVMVLSAYGYVGGFLLFAFANSVWYESAVLSFIAFTLIGVFSSIYWPASHAMIADIVPEKDRPEVFAVFYSAVNLAVVIGPVLGSVLFFEYRFALLVASSIASLLLAVVLQRYLRETVPNKAVEAMTASMVFLNQIKSYRLILKDRVFLLFVLGGVCVATVFMQLDLIIALHMREAAETISIFGLEIDGIKAYGMVMAENGLLVVLMTVMMARWMGRLSAKWVFVASSLLYAIGILIFGLATFIPLYFFAMLLFTVGELMVVGLQDSFIGQIAPEDQRGQYYAAAGLRYTFSRMIAPLALTLAAFTSNAVAIGVVSFLAVLGAGIYLMMFTIMEREGVSREDEAV